MRFLSMSGKESTVNVVLKCTCTVDFKYKGPKVFGDLGQKSLVLETNCINVDFDR